MMVPGPSGEEEMNYQLKLPNINRYKNKKAILLSIAFFI